MAQMFDHQLDNLKGWFGESAVDYSAPMAASVVKSPVPAGSVASLNSDGHFQPGASGHLMPIYLRQGTDSLDVANDGGNDWKAIQPRGNLSGLVAIGGFELATTEFDRTEDYPPNALLTSPTEATVGAGNEDEAGIMYTAANWTGGGGGAVAISTHNICGIVSRGVITSSHSNAIELLVFWSYFLPAGV